MAQKDMNAPGGPDSMDISHPEQLEEMYDPCDSVEPLEPPRPPHDPTDPLQNTYELVKCRFENSNFKVRHPLTFITIPPDTQERIDQYDEQKFRQLWRDVKYYASVTDERTGKSNWVKSKFIDKWLDDENKRYVERLVVDPERKMEGNVYNMWTGFRAETLPPVDPDLVPELVKPYVQHIHDVWTNGVQAHTDWVIAWLSHMFQRPGTKTGVAVSLFGAEGCGKNCILDCHRFMVMGEHCTYQTSNPDMDVFGTFAKGQVNTILCVVDEANKSLKQSHDRLKDAITNKTINYQAKQKNTIVLNSYTNFVFTSNYENVMEISQNDRRMVLFKCSNVHTNNIAGYFAPFTEYLARDDVVRAIYQYHMAVDITEYAKNMQACRPITDYYREMQRACMPIVPRYLSAICNSEIPNKELLSSVMYEQCRKFTELSGLRWPGMSNIEFSKKLKEIIGDPVHKNKGNFYRIDIQDIVRRLKFVNAYDQDAYWIEPSRPSDLPDCQPPYAMVAYNAQPI